MLPIRGAGTALGSGRILGCKLLQVSGTGVFTLLSTDDGMAPIAGGDFAITVPYVFVSTGVLVVGTGAGA